MLQTKLSLWMHSVAAANELSRVILRTTRRQNEEANLEFNTDTWTDVMQGEAHKFCMYLPIQCFIGQKQIF